MEQTKLEELLQSTLECRDGPAFQKVMGMLLREEDSAMDFNYDLNLRVKGGAGYRPINAAPSASLLQAYEDVTRVLKRVFKRHNAKRVRLNSKSLYPSFFFKSPQISIILSPIVPSLVVLINNFRALI